MSNQALAVVREQAIERAPLKFNNEQLQLIKDSYAKGTSDAEFALFVRTAEHLRLDPFKRQICLISFWDSKLKKDVFQPAITIDGQRSKAQDTGLYEGQTKPEWCGPDAVWVDVWLSNEPPAAARVGVYRTGFREAVYGVARFSSYAARRTDNGELIRNWKSMPDVMIAKCAEAMALRKAFPDEMSGIYAPEEMEQANNNAPATKTPSTSRPKPTAMPTASSPQEQALNEALLAYCVKLKKGEKNGQAFFDATMAKKSISEKQAEVIRLGLDVVEPETDGFVDAEIVEPATESVVV